MRLATDQGHLRTRLKETERLGRFIVLTTATQGHVTSGRERVLEFTERPRPTAQAGHPSQDERETVREPWILASR